MLAAVFKTYGPLEDAATGQPLFNKNAWKSAKNLLKNVQMGYLSDPPGIPLYYSVGIDKKEGGFVVGEQILLKEVFIILFMTVSLFLPSLLDMLSIALIILCFATTS